MLVPKHNILSSEHLIACERTMLKFVDGKLSSKTGMEFKVWDWQIPELYGIVLGMFVKLGLKETLGIRKSEMLDFIIDVEKGYYKTSYHSFYHAVDVVAVLYYMLKDLGAESYLTSLDAICLLIAGLCHDIGHPGLNNVYQVNARTNLASKYNDQSVLENHSCTLTMDIITQHRIFRNIHTCSNEYLACDPKEVDTILKDLITKIILATDMSFHFDLLESLHNMIKSTSPCSSEESGEEMDNGFTSSASSISSSPENSSAFIKSTKRYTSESGHLQIRSRRRSPVITSLDSEQRELLLKVLLHAADLSNTVRPWDISKRWSDLVVEEFFHQGDLEKQNNLPVSPNMDRKKAHQCQISLGFGDFVVKPYFEAFASFLHQATIFLDILAENRICWDDMKNAPPQPPPTLLTPISDDDDSSSSSLDDNYSKGQRRVSLAAGLLIIPDDIQEKLRLMASQRHTKNHKKLKRSLSGRSYSHHALLPAHPGSLAPDDDDDDDDDYEDNDPRKPTRSKSSGPSSTFNTEDSSPPSLIITPVSSDAITNSNSTNSHFTNGKKANNNHQKRLGRMRRSSSLDHNMIRQITSLCGTGDSQPEQRVVVAGS